MNNKVNSIDTPKVIIIVDGSMKKEMDLFLLGTKTNTTLQTLSVIQELTQQDGVEVEVVYSQNYKRDDLEVPKIIKVINESARLHIEHKLLCLGVDDYSDIVIDGSKGLTIEMIDELIYSYSKLLSEFNNSEEKIGKPFTDLFEAMKGIEYQSYSTTPTKNREGSKEGYYHNALTKRRSKSKQAKKSRRKNRK